MPAPGFKSDPSRVLRSSALASRLARASRAIEANDAPAERAIVDRGQWSNIRQSVARRGFAAARAPLIAVRGIDKDQRPVSCDPI
jgi:hypothetical protein